jgi:hypothetical protein
MPHVAFSEPAKLIPLLEPKTIAATVTNTDAVDLLGVHWATLCIQFGAITDDVCNVKVEASTAASTSGTDKEVVGFRYRLTAAVGTDEHGAITTASSDGVTASTSDDNKMLIIDIDPSQVAALGADYRYVRAVIAPSSDNTATYVSAFGVLQSRYPANVILPDVT